MKIGKFSLHESRCSKTICAVFLFWVAAVIGSSAQTFVTLVSFDGTDGNDPVSTVVQGFDGNFYGTTRTGGANGSGTIFKTTSEGTLTTVYTFCAQTNCTDGANPNGVVQGRDGNFYGTTFSGGVVGCGADTSGCGTVFKLTPSGVLTTLYAFTNGNDGGSPEYLMQAADGNFYGVTTAGKHIGTVFKITAKGALTTLVAFGGANGGVPQGLMQATDGNFYGTTFSGTGSYGTVFKMTPTGQLTTLHSFVGTDGAHPEAGLVQANDGNFYGTTISRRGPNLPGTVFKMTPAGDVSVLYNFCVETNCPDGDDPQSVLVQGTDGNLYGTTVLGGVLKYGCGTIFQITTGGTLTTLHTFEQTDGCNPMVGLLQATNGNFYGTTIGGGPDNGVGTVFSLSMGLGPFVATNPTTGKAGTRVGILGTSLEGATAVSFNGTAAKFSVAGKSAIVATVPAGATTGFVTVTTPSGMLTSNVPFQITK